MQYGLILLEIQSQLCPDHHWPSSPTDNMTSKVPFLTRSILEIHVHDSWDFDVLTLGKVMRGQADIRDVSKNTAPL